MAKHSTTRRRLSAVQISIICLLVGLVSLVIVQQIRDSRQKRPVRANGAVSDFATCKAAGNPIGESYPRVCTINNGQSFTEPLEPVTGEYAQFETRRGKVVQYDARLTGGGVSGQLTIESNPGVTNSYYVGNDGSVDCDRSLVMIVQTNGIKLGDLVEVRSQLAGLKAESGQGVPSIGFSVVCGEGTFIKKLDPSAI